MSKSLLLFLILFAQISHADIDCSAINSNCGNSANSATEAPVGFFLGNVQNIANKINGDCETHPERVDKSGHLNALYQVEVKSYCGCINQKVVNTIKKEKLSCDSFNSYLYKAQDNMQKNAWRFAGEAWKSSFHSKVTVINTLNSAFKSQYDSCSINKITQGPEAIKSLFVELSKEFEKLKNTVDTPKRTKDLKNCVDNYKKRYQTNDPTFMLEFNQKMQRTFGGDLEKFAKDLKSEHDFLTGVTDVPGSCTSPAEQAVLNSIPTWDQLETIKSYQAQLTPDFLDDLYRRRMTSFGLSANEEKILKLFDNEPRLKLLYSKVGKNTDEQKKKLFATIAKAIEQKESKKGKFANIGVFEELFKDPYYKEIVSKTCDELSNDFVALICANDEHFPMSDRSVMSSIPDNYNLLGDAGTHIDQDLKEIDKVCGADTQGKGCQNRSMAFEAVYCEAVKDNELNEYSSETSKDEKFLESDSLVSSSKNQIFSEYVFDNEMNVQSIKTINNVLNEKQDHFYGSSQMCSQINSVCLNFDKTSFEYVNCRLDSMSKDTDSAQNGYYATQLKQFSQYVDFCKSKANKKTYDDTCRENLLKLGMDMSHGSFKVDQIEANSVTVTYGFDKSQENIAEIDPTVPQDNIQKPKIDLVSDHNVEIKKDENLKFSRDNSLKVKKNIEDTLNNLKNNDLNFTQQYTTLKNVQPAVVQQIKESEQEVVKEKENIANIDQKIRRSKTSQERELLELERALMEKNLKEKEKSLVALKGQADRLSQLVQDLEKKISEQGSVQSNKQKVFSKGLGQEFNGDEIYNQQNNFNSKRGYDFQNQNIHNNGSNGVTSGQANFIAGARGASGFREQSSDDFKGNDPYLQNEQDKIDRDRGSLKLNAVPMSLNDLSQIESVEKLQEVLSTYGLTDGPFYLYDKKSDLLTKVIGYKVVDNQIVYEVLKDGQVQIVQAKNLKTDNSRVPASIEPIKVESPQQVRKYSLEILSNILKIQ